MEAGKWIGIRLAGLYGVVESRTPGALSIGLIWSWIAREIDGARMELDESWLLNRIGWNLDVDTTEKR